MQLPGWLIYSGRACTGTTNLGMTTNTSLDGELLALEVVVGISMGMILQCLEEAISMPTRVVEGDVLLVETLTSIGTVISVTPSMVIRELELAQRRLW